MKLTVLIENKKGDCNAKVKAVHGLSFYIEMKGKKILVDVGPSSLLKKNAEALGIDLAEIDILFLSHGHIDHGGGLSAFFEINKKAQVYMHKSVQEQFYTKLLGVIPYYVGLKRELIFANSGRITFVTDDLKISDNLFILTNFQKDFPEPESNKALFKMQDIPAREGSSRKQVWVKDDFDHEIAILLKENDGNVLISSCSHSGILNIVKTAITRHAEKIKGVVGGFHLYNPVKGSSESKVYISDLAEALSEIDTQYYTCHCTGPANVDLLKKKLGPKLNTIHTGDSLIM